MKLLLIKEIVLVLSIGLPSLVEAQDKATPEFIATELDSICSPIA